MRFLHLLFTQFPKDWLGVIRMVKEDVVRRTCSDCALGSKLFEH
jgi:hypothetical protein